MKYYSEITKKTYDTVEKLIKAEESIKTQFEEKGKKAQKSATPLAQNTEDNAPVNARKEAAQRVDDALSKLAEIKATNKAKQQELADVVEEIENKYNKIFRELEDKKAAEIKQQTDKAKALDKEVIEQTDIARKELSDFCKKYGAYHCSVDAKNAGLYPFLWSIRQQEIFQNVFGDLLDIFNRF